MPSNGIDGRMLSWYLAVVIFHSIRAEGLFNTAGGGGGFLVDPFLELTGGGATTPPDPKSNKLEPSCLSSGTLTVTIICTLLLSALIGFLTWLIYLREKLQELRLYKKREKRNVRSLSQQYLQTAPSPATSNYPKSSRRHPEPDDRTDHNGHPLPLDVTDCKFGTFPFRQSQTPSVNGHYNHTDWLHRAPSSFRSAHAEQGAEMIDIELLDPTFCGLNFSITGNMRAGIFVKEILEKETAQGCLKLNSSDQLQTGDRIMALTVCFQSIVYEDALTILSYASPYPVILRVQRPSHSTKLTMANEKRVIPTNPTVKVKWRDDFEHYDNDTSNSRSLNQQNSSMTLSTDTKPILASKQHRFASSKKARTQQTSSEDRLPPSAAKTSKTKGASNTVLATSGSINKRSKNDLKKHRQKITQKVIPNQPMLISTGLSAKPIDKISTPPMASNKATMKSVTNAVISYLHYRGAHGGQGTGKQNDDHNAGNRSEGSVMPYYDSPYDYYYDGHQAPSHLNRNNNNSLATESLTAVTSLPTTQLLQSQSREKATVQQPLFVRRNERGLSSSVTIVPPTIKSNDDQSNALNQIDTSL